MAFHPRRDRRYGITFLQCRQDGAVSGGLRLVPAPNPEMAVEDHLLATGRQPDLARIRPFRGDLDPAPGRTGAAVIWLASAAVPDKPVELHRRAVEPPPRAPPAPARSRSAGSPRAPPGHGDAGSRNVRGFAGTQSPP